MNFFESQDAARKQTGRLVFLFGVAVVSMILSIYLIVTLALAYVAGPEAGGIWNPGLFLAVVAATVTVVTFGSLYKVAQLKGGGRVVAESLGGRLVARDSQDALERKVLNVVEEIAIAAGTPVPPVYLMAREQGINAFAAGYTPNDAVIGVTRGTIEQLNRSELQGVIAHEFSHILNGDMRLNIRLMGILNGILVIGLIGYFVLRSFAFGGRVRSRDRNGGGVMIAILAVGAGLAVVGFMGTLCGNLIKAAVSRQREYLADASAVQFTRDPASIGGALKRIGGFVNGSAIADPHAAEASHMFFAKGLTSGLTSMFATHPALEDRIRRIEPGWDGTYPPPRVIEAEVSAPNRGVPEGIDIAEVIVGGAILAGAGGSASAGAAVAGGALSQIGQPTMAHVEYAANLVSSLPDPVVAAAHEVYGARAVIYALLIDNDVEIRTKQLSYLEARSDEGTNRLVGKLLAPMTEVAPEARLPLIDIATATLRDLTASQYEDFRTHVLALEAADDRLSLFEWVLQRMILRHLEPQFRKMERTYTEYYSLARLGQPCSVLLSALARNGHDEPAEVQRAFAHGAQHLKAQGLVLLDPADCSLSALDEALAVLDTVAFKQKRSLLEAGIGAVSADGQVTVIEGEMLRGIADALGCPMPPLLPGQPIA